MLRNHQVGNEISASGAAIKGGPAKINIGMFSNKIVELVKASETVMNLDQVQYLSARSHCERIQMQIILSLTQLRNIFERES